MNAEVTRIVKEFKRKSGIQQVYLIGSHTTGAATPESDIDLLLVDARFEGKPSFQRPVGLRRFWTPGVAVDFICLTPAEFNTRKKRPTLARLAVEEGVAIT